MSREPLPRDYAGLPAVTARDMKKLDSIAGDKHGLSTLSLMENAGRAAAREIILFLSHKKPAERGGRILVFCGRGFNGGDGLVLARYIKEAGIEVSVFICPPRKEGPHDGAYPEPVHVNLGLARDAGIEVLAWLSPDAAQDALPQADVVVDAILGTGTSGKPAGPAREMIQAVTRSKKPVAALDLPSGLNPDTGHHSGVYITADLTLCLGLAKRGLLAAHAAKYVGQLKVLDIGYPRELLVSAAYDEEPSR